MKKINNSFKEEYKDIKTFIRNIKIVLKAKRKASLIFWIIFSALIALTNITILTISSVALDKVITEYNADPTKADFTSQVLPTALVSFVSISLFIISIIISIYQGSMKSSMYKQAYEAVQYEYINFLKDKSKDEEAFKKSIEKISNKALSTKNKKSVRKTLLNILIGGNDE